MGGDIRVSVVLSVRNGARDLRPCLDSLLGQTLGDFEVLVVDDGSTDETAELLRSHPDSRLRVLTPPDRDDISVWEHALAHASAPLVVRMHADDLALPERFARQVAHLDAHPDIALLGTGGKLVDERGDSVRLHETFATDFALRLALLRGNPFMNGSVMCRRAAFDAVGGYRFDRHPAEDYDLWCRIAATGATIANLLEELHGYRLHDASTDSVARRDQEAAERRVREECTQPIRALVLDAAAVRAAAAAYQRTDDPRVRAEWPEVVAMLERELVRDVRAGRVGNALRTLAAALAADPATSTRAALGLVRSSVQPRPRRDRPAPVPPNPLRVMYVLDSLGPGGTERSTALLLEPLQRRGIAGEVVCLRHAREGDEDRVIREGFPVHVLSARTALGQIIELRARIRATRPDVVHTAVYGADVVGRLAAQGTGVPVVSSLISTPYDPARRDDPRITPWKLELARRIDGFTARHCTARLHAVTEGTALANCRDLGVDPAHVTVVERGRPPDEFAPVDAASRAAARARLGLDPADRVVLSLGRHAFQKAFPDLVRAAGILVHRLPTTRVLIAGAPGPATPELEAARDALDRPARDRVEILGYRTDVPDLLHACDAFVMASRWEGTAGAVLEAMACGLPVVTTRVDGLQGVVEDGHNALVVPVGDPSALATALEHVLTDDALARSLGVNGRRTFVDRFTLEPSADAMAALYRDVVAQEARLARR